MATITKHTTFATGVKMLGTELNSLTTATNSGATGSGDGTVYDNTSGLYMYADFLFNIAAQGTARSAGATISVYLLVSYDGGTTYTRLNETTAGGRQATIALDAATTATLEAANDVPLPPAFIKIFCRNNTGQSFAASGNTVYIYPHNLQSV